jgi:geranylgeranyl pyrophosphate synthase
MIWDNSIHGLKPVKTEDEPDYAWNWFSAQLDNGTEISATNLVDPYKKVTFDNYAVILGKERLEFESSRFEPLKKWRSCRSFLEYPTEWKLTVPEIDLELNIKAEIQDQEFLTMIARPAFWEGRVIVTGKIGAEQVSGFGFVEVYGHDDLRCMKNVLKNVGKCVLEEIEHAVPLQPNDSQLAELIGGDEYVDGFGTEVYKKTVLQPIRDITDRGGKSWRSYALLLCIDAVGGDSRTWRNWLGLPELVHTGSLIVDDVQDKSLIRRGGPSVHLIYGEPLAINAGSAAYFLTSMIKFPKDLPELTKVQIYDLYFQGLRSGHAGQALDIHGLNYIMDEVVQSGEGKKLEKMVMAIHKLKSAAPAASVAKMGAIAGHGSADQVKKFGKYFEALGVAFQIFDDVLNLRGFEGNLKDRGEDLAQGKVTYPVAKAMSRLSSLHQREWLWNTIKSKPQDRSVIESCIDLIEECGGLSEAASEGMQMMEDAWNELDACIVDSYYKIMLRSLSYYLLDRMY